MNRRTFSSFRNWALAGVAVAAIASPAWAEEARQFQIPQQSLVAALEAFGKQGDKEILFSKAQAEGHATAGVTGTYEPQQALAMLLSGSGLKFRQVNDNTYVVESAAPQSGSAAGDGADQGTVAALIVTAQKKEENVQDVPIAISAFTEKTLQEQKIEGGFDLLKAIPNVTFSKNNFTSYNFSIRGVGTKAVSATTDPGVAVSFNNIALLQNRLFEQEYFDVERVEVLRGPQGTLYGRNATAGVINVISAKPNLQEFDGWLKGEVGNYHAKRLSAMVNIPVVEDKLAVRVAGSLTDRQGYDYNSVTKHAINGRDLWSGRITVAFNPTDRFRSNLVWERFDEDDNRSRTGKQLCHRDPGPTEIGGVSIADSLPGYAGTPGTDRFETNLLVQQGTFSQGCKPGSLYDNGAFGTPNGMSINFIQPLLAGRDDGIPFIATGIGLDPACVVAAPFGIFDLGCRESIVKGRDPYGGLEQSHDLRTIASFRDPIYRAKADVVELNLEYDLTDALTIYSQTAYNKDETYSFQDFNRFNTLDVFTDTSKLLYPDQPDLAMDNFSDLAPGGVFCDPQLGCSKTIAGFDIAKAKGEQFTQEFRLQSNFDGPVNVSLGANYTRFRTLIDYYVFYNVLSALAESMPVNNPAGTPFIGTFNPGYCSYSNFFEGLLAPDFGSDFTEVPTSDPTSACPYVDPNPIESIDGEGHNYFRSKNPYKLKSWAAFGEVYWNIREDLKLTAGLRHTNDEKRFIPVPSQVLLAPSFTLGGTVPKGYPERPPIDQKWGEWTGRLVIDWKPDLGFTDSTLVYGSYSHGYKGGGANPPKPGFASAEEIEQILIDQGYPPEIRNQYNENGPENGGANIWPVLALNGAEYGDTFKPEFVDAFEVGAKNTLMNGALTLNLTGFLYDYKDYQVSQIRDRSAVNENFDARNWGLELESIFAPSRNIQIIANIGYLDTRIADGERSIDIMDRTQGNADYTVVKPWIQLPSNCVIPTAVAAYWLEHDGNAYYRLCGVGGFLGYIGAVQPIIDPNPDIGGGLLPYDSANYPELNGGAGLYADVGGNELPNAPHWTANIGAQYGHEVLDGSWRATVRADAYWQSQSWARVYNDNPYDKLHGWYNLNLSVWFERPDDDLKIELYAKNILDKTPITDAFLNSDDTALTTNVFVLDPRLIGLSIKKGF